MTETSAKCTCNALPAHLPLTWKCPVHGSGAEEMSEDRWREIARRNGTFVGYLSVDPPQGEMRTWSENDVCRAIAEAVAQERERCVEICMEWAREYTHMGDWPKALASETVAAAIRQPSAEGRATEEKSK
jgi:hypothetical protein